MMFEEIFSMMPPGNMSLSFQVALGVLRADFPWLYDSGMDLVKVLKGRNSAKDKDEAMQTYFHLLDFTFEHPMLREIIALDKESTVYHREIGHLLKKFASKIYKDDEL